MKLRTGSWMAVVAALALSLAGCSGTGDANDVGPQTVDEHAGSAQATNGNPGTPNDDASAPVPLNIFAAASTRVFESELSQGALSLPDPAALTFNFDGSSGLVQQMADGAPADLFISADRRNMDKAAEKGLVEAPVKVAENSMVMVVPRGNPAGITGVDESLQRAVLVLCDEQVPCGGVSAAIEEDLGVDLRVASYESKVSDVLGKVVSGEADAGWVYRTDAAAAGTAVEVIEIPRADNHVNELWAAVAKASTHPDEAAGVLTYLSGPEFANTWQDYGFRPVTQG